MHFALRFLNKQKFNTELEKQGIVHPKSFSTNDKTDIKEIAEKIRYPCIVKPASSEFFRLDFNTKFFMVETKKQLMEKYTKAVSRNHEVIIQEVIPGDAGHMYGFNTYYTKKFESYGNFVFRRIRQWPPFSGNGILIENVEKPELEKIITSLIKKIKYHGIVDAEFKIDPRDNTINLIEINPRCWMQVSLPLRCRINLPYTAYLDVLDKKIEKINPSKDTTKWLFFYQDLPAALKDIKDNNLTFRDWILSYKGKKEYAIFSWEDPLPFFKFLGKIRHTY